MIEHVYQMKTKTSLLLFIFLMHSPFIFSQPTKRAVTVEDVWERYAFYANSVSGINWTKDGNFYTYMEDAQIKRYDIKNGKALETLYGNFLGNNFRPFDDYQLSPQEDQLLLATETDPIYRRSSESIYYIYHLKDKKLTQLSDGAKQSYATFSPNGEKIAYVSENDLFVFDLASQETQQLTKDGKFNEIINGSADWVYEEEFSFAKAFFWSPDSKKIAFYTFNESEVKEYNMQLWEGTEYPYPYDYRFKYPKAGEKNSTIRISVVDLDKNLTRAMDIGEETDIYIPRINWTQDSNILSIRRMNRLQNQLDILHADVNTGKTKLILSEKSDSYVDLDFCDDLTYLKDGKSFLHSSEKDGFKHLYHYDIDGKLIRQITQGEWEIDQVYGIDEENKLIYFSSTEVSPLERHIYRIGLNGKQKKQLSTTNGVHRPNFSKDFQFYLDFFSSASLPTQVSLHEAKSAEELRVLENNNALQKRLEGFRLSSKEFFSFKTSKGDELNGWMIKPLDFDESKEYPVLMFVYGGPGSQQVMNSWNSYNHFWYQVLASKGYLIACVDNRGTGGRGANFKKVTYGQLGKYETEDQIEAANYLGKLAYVDPNRIGIWGWSYGGYMSSLCITKGADVFSAAIAVAPVSTWRFYDTIYTERYLKTPQLNPSGYDDNSPINHVQKLIGKFLLVHGTGDDNVHVQNSIELQDALIAADKQFQLFYYPNRNHGIYGGNTRSHLYKMMTNFILNNL